MQYVEQLLRHGYKVQLKKKFQKPFETIQKLEVNVYQARTSSCPDFSKKHFGLRQGAGIYRLLILSKRLKSTYGYPKHNNSPKRINNLRQVTKKRRK